MRDFDLPRVPVVSLAKREEEVFVPGGRPSRSSVSPPGFTWSSESATKHIALRSATTGGGPARDARSSTLRGSDHDAAARSSTSSDPPSDSLGVTGRARSRAGPSALDGPCRLRAAPPDGRAGDASAGLPAPGAPAYGRRRSSAARDAARARSGRAPICRSQPTSTTRRRARRAPCRRRTVRRAPTRGPIAVVGDQRARLCDDDHGDDRADRTAARSAAGAACTSSPVDRWPNRDAGDQRGEHAPRVVSFTTKCASRRARPAPARGRRQRRPGRRRARSPRRRRRTARRRAGAGPGRQGTRDDRETCRRASHERADESRPTTSSASMERRYVDARSRTTPQIEQPMASAGAQRSSAIAEPSARARRRAVDVDRHDRATTSQRRTADVAERCRGRARSSPTPATYARSSSTSGHARSDRRLEAGAPGATRHACELREWQPIATRARRRCTDAAAVPEDSAVGPSRTVTATPDGRAPRDCERSGAARVSRRAARNGYR